MLTLKLISEETERVIKGLEKKHFPNAREAVEKVLEYDKIRREAQQKLDTNKQQANQFAKQIGALMKEGRSRSRQGAGCQSESRRQGLGGNHGEGSARYDQCTARNP